MVSLIGWSPVWTSVRFLYDYSCGYLYELLYGYRCDYIVIGMAIRTVSCTAIYIANWMVAFMVISTFFVRYGYF